MTRYFRAILLAIALLCATAGAHAQGGNLGSNSSPAANNLGRPLPGINVSICQPLATTAATVTSNLAVLTMASNPITAGFSAGMQIQVASFTGGDTYLNGGSIVNGQITAGFPILSVTSTTITYALTHANATASSNGTVLQEGNATTSCGGLSTITSDPALTVPITQPLITDALGNWNAFAAPGVYYAQFYGAGVTTVLKQYAIACVPGSSAPLCGAISVGGPTVLSGVGKFDGNCLVDGVQNATLAAAVTCAGSSGVIEIPMFAVPGIGGAVTIPAGVTLRFDGPSGITTTGFSLTINGPLVAPATQIFFGTGTVTIAPVQPLNAMWFPGADILAQIANAYAAFPAAPTANTILVPPNPSGGCWTATTAISLATPSKYPILLGTAPTAATSSFGRAGSCVNYTPTSGTMITLDYVPMNGSSYFSGHGIQNIAFVNNNCTTNGGCGGTAIGVAMGTTNGGAQRALFQNNGFEGWATAFSNTNGTSWGQVSIANTYTHNATAVSLMAGPLEQMLWTHNLFITNGTDITNNGADLVVEGGSWDGHTIVGYSGTNGSTATFVGVHFENFGNATVAGTHYINSTGQVTIIGGAALDDTAVGNTDYWFTVNNAMIRGLAVSTAGRTVTNLAAINGFADMQFQIASANLTPCPTFATTSVCSIIGTGVPNPFVRAPTVRLGTTAGDYTVAPTAGDSGHTGTFPPTTGQVLLTGSGASNPVQRLRVSGCATGAAQFNTCNTTVTWPNAFADANYTVSCTGDLTTSGVPVSGGVVSKNNSAVTHITIALTAAAAQFTTVDCVAVHD